MTNKLSLEKRTQTVKLSLEKSGVVKDKICLRVALALDKSGSAQSFYERGQFNELVDRLLPVAANMDDDGTIDTWLFHNRSFEVEPATPKNYGSYITNVIMKGKHRNDWGGTSYAPVIKDIHHHYFGTEEKKGFFGFGGGKKPVTADNTPALVFFITDGANDDKSATRQLLDSIKDEPVYWMTVGIGPEHSFGFLREIADTYDNVGFISFKDLDMSDEKLYDSILNGELAEWINKVS